MSPEKPQNKPSPEQELPHLPAFDKKLFYSFQWSDLLSNLLLIVFGALVSDQLFAKEGLFYRLPAWQNLSMYCLVVLTLPWYFGYLYVCNSVYFGKRVMKFFLWIYILITLVSLVNMVRLGISQYNEQKDLYNITGFVEVLSSFLLVLGPMMCLGGSATAYNQFSKDGNSNHFDPSKPSVTGILFMLLLAIALMIWILGQFPENSGFGVVLLAYLGGPFLATIVYALFLGLLSLLDSWGVYRYLSLAAKFSFPMFITAVLVFWSGVAIYFMKNDFSSGNGKVAWGGLLFTVIASGLLPYRLISLLNAPLRLSNLMLGTASLLFFLYRLSTLI